MLPVVLNLAEGRRAGRRPVSNIFRMLQMSGRDRTDIRSTCTDTSCPPPQDAVCGLRGADATDVIKQRAAIQAHAQMLNGTVPPGHAHTPELERALRFKPRAEEFI